MDKLKLVRNDTAPNISCTIVNGDTNTPIDLTSATGVLLKVREVGLDTLQATVPGTIINPTGGIVLFLPSTVPEMLSGEPGNYEGEIEITFNNGTIQSVYNVLKFKLRQDF